MIFQTRSRFCWEKLARVPLIFYKNISLGFKTHQETVEGSYIDKKCSFIVNVSIRGQIFSGIMTKMKIQRTIAIHYIQK
uniref:LOC100169746 protein n=1 Tax=Rattus norvegicus TaxID=10116 RepID=B0BND7_RAT|nr:LOC100169746 protein [Rattus norvegicus]